MILLDTNVVSELMRLNPNPLVLQWVDHNSHAGLLISAITQAEIALGIALLPDGKRKEALASAAESMFAEDFAGESLPFDGKSSRYYAAIVALRTQIGRPISAEDAQIAAIALSNKLALATRNTRDFDAIGGLSLINPWL